jgi:nuclear transport factor 2 (NTF2) superfamily protein
MSRPPLPPSTLESAIEKVRLAEDGWNSGDPVKVSSSIRPSQSQRENPCSTVLRPIGSSF